MPRTRINNGNRLSTLMDQATGMLQHSRTYMIGAADHQMGQTNIDGFSELDTPGVEDWLKEFAKPPPRIEAGANGAASIEHAQNVRLSATVKQNVRRLHVMCVYYLRAGHPVLFLQFFSNDRRARFHEEFKGMPKKEEQRSEFR